MSDLTAAQTALQNRARSLARDVVAPGDAETDRTEAYPRTTVEALTGPQDFIAERAASVRGAMTAEPIGGRNVLLVDDVMQSMATFGEAARAVRAAGATTVVCIALVVVETAG